MKIKSDQSSDMSYNSEENEGMIAEAEASMQGGGTITSIERQSLSRGLISRPSQFVGNQSGIF